MIHDAGRIPLATPEATAVIPLNGLKQMRDGWIAKANDFYTGAVKFLQAGQFSLYGLMLHKLMRHARRFNPEMGNSFPRDTDLEIRLFQLLQKAGHL